MNFKEYQTKYIFKYDINDEIKKLNEENKALKAEFKKKDEEFDILFKKKDEEFQNLNFKFNILFMGFISFIVFISFIIYYLIKYFK